MGRRSNRIVFPKPKKQSEGFRETSSQRGESAGDKEKACTKLKHPLPHPRPSAPPPLPPPHAPSKKSHHKTLDQVKSRKINNQKPPPSATPEHATKKTKLYCCTSQGNDKKRPSLQQAYTHSCLKKQRGRTGGNPLYRVRGCRPLVAPFALSVPLGKKSEPLASTTPTRAHVSR